MGYVPLKVPSKKHVHALVGFLLVGEKTKTTPFWKLPMNSFVKNSKKEKRKKKEREKCHTLLT